ncbi:MAG: hypothetical protein ACXVDT_05545 [Bacteroidia bacterium]
MKKRIFIFFITGILLSAACKTGRYTGRGVLVKKHTKKCAECPSK